MAREDLDRIKRLLGEQISHFKLLEKDIARQEIDEITPMYTIDFYEIHTYMYPFGPRKEIYETEIVKDMMETYKGRFILLPGTLEEIFRHIKAVIQKEGFYMKWKYREFRKDTTVNSFLEAFDKRKDDKTIYSLYTQLKKRYNYLIRVLEGISPTRGSIRRLSQIMKEKNLVFPEEVGIKISENDIEEKVLNTAYQELDIIRWGNKLSNWVDAHNFAATYALNEKYYRLEFR
ncbi:MAG: hypothetical protein AB1414_11210 [bacterium]